MLGRTIYHDLFVGTDYFTAGTRLCLERGVGRALLGRRGDGVALRTAVHRATRELLVQGLNAPTVITVLGGLVEDAGRWRRADRTSLLSGEPTWMLVRRRVVGAARNELARCGVVP